MNRAEAIDRVKDMRDFIIRFHAPNDVWVSHMNEAIKVLSEIPQCKFRSQKNCDFCAFHSDCDEHWDEKDANDRQVTGKLNSEIEKSKSEIVPDYRDGWRLKEGDEK